MMRPIAISAATARPSQVDSGVLRVLARPAYSNRESNPYNWSLYTHLSQLDITVHEHSRRRFLTGSYDVWHLHWPESSLNLLSAPAAAKRLFGLLAMMRVARFKRMKIVWTIHNLEAHEQQHPRLAGWFWPAFVDNLDGYISLTAAGRQAALDRFPRLAQLPGGVIPHGHYRDCYPMDVGRAEARARLGLHVDAQVVTFLGQVRRYKGLTRLCHAFRGLNRRDARLLIAGQSKDAALERQLREAARADDRVRLHLGFIPDEDIQLFLKAADLVALPFTSTLNSGSALLALSFDRPILVPHSEVLAELRDVVGHAWLRTYTGELTAPVLDDAIKWSHQACRSSRPPLDAFEWSAIARQTASTLKTVLRSSCRPNHGRRSPSGNGLSVPLVSVIIPVHNRATLVGRAIRSVLAQTYQHFEMLVVDDGSTDGTADVVRGIRDGRIRYYRHAQRLGGAAARNTGIRASSGDFVAFLDSDDEWLPTKVAAQLDVFGAGDECLGLVYTGSEILEHGGARIRRIPRYRGNLARELSTVNVVGSASCVMVRRSSLEAVGWFDERLPALQDMDLWLRISQAFGVDYVPSCEVRIDQSGNHERISSDPQNRIAARRLFYAKHRDVLWRSRQVHKYLRDSGRLHHHRGRDVNEARRLYWQSIRARPLGLSTWLLLATSVVPLATLSRAARVRRWCLVNWQRFTARPFES